MSYEIDDKPFHEILHAMLRHDDDPIAMGQITEVMDWFHRHHQRIKTVFQGGMGAEWELYRTVYRYFLDNKTPPSRDKLRDLIVQQNGKPTALIDLVEAYETLEGDLKLIRAGDLNVPLEARVGDYEKYKTYQLLSKANSISQGSWQPKGKDEKPLSGPRDAFNFLMEQFQQGILVDQEPMVGGTLDKTAGTLAGRYEANEADRRANKLFIKSGIDWIDSEVGGFRRKELNGILGYTGQRKSMVARSIAYHAALTGNFVLHIPLESDYDEEETIYSVFHSSYFKNSSRITKLAVDRGELTKEQSRFYREVVVPSFQRTVAPNLAVYGPAQNSWAEVKSIIERVNFQRKIDLIVLDYITVLRTPGNKDDIADKSQIIQDVKQLAMTTNNGEGVSVLTPIQGNRAGYDEAGTSDGEWYLTGIFKYSEIEKSLDNCFYIWFNQGLEASGQVKMGSCKGRRTGPKPPRSVPFDACTGLVGKGGGVDGSGSCVRPTEVKVPLSRMDTIVDPVIDGVRMV